MKDERKGLTKRLWMLTEADIHCLDGCSKGLHNGEYQGIAKDESQQHINNDGSIFNIGSVSVTLMYQD